MSGKHHHHVQEPREYHSFEESAHADVVEEVSRCVPDDEEHEQDRDKSDDDQNHCLATTPRLLYEIYRGVLFDPLNSQHQQRA